MPTDVADYPQVEALARQALGDLCNAAVSAYATFKEQSLEDFRQILEINFMGQVHCAKAALPYLEETAGALGCVGSTLSDRGVPLQGAYCASKHALKGWIDSLRVELLKEGSKVRITLIKPSSINTPLFNKAKMQMGVMPQSIPPIYEPELALEAILRAAESNERDILRGAQAQRVSGGCGAPHGLGVRSLRHLKVEWADTVHRGADRVGRLAERICGGVGGALRRTPNSRN